MDWARILAYVTGTVDQELLGRNEYLAAENRILKEQLKHRPKLSDAERRALGEIGYRLGRKVMLRHQLKVLRRRMPSKGEPTWTRAAALWRRRVNRQTFSAFWSIEQGQA